MPALASLHALLGLWVLCLAQESSSSDFLKPDDDVKTVLAKVLKVYGGHQARSRWSCGHLKYKTKGGVVPSLFGEVTIEDTFQLPGHFKRVTHIHSAGQQKNMIFVVNHGRCWTKADDGLAREEPGQNKFTDKTEHPFANLCDPSVLSSSTGLGTALTKLGEDNINGHHVIAIRAKFEALGESDDLFFDSETGYLRKSVITRASPQRHSAGPMACILDDYKNVQGIPVPMRIKETQNGKTVLDVTLIEVKFETRFDESTFAKP